MKRKLTSGLSIHMNRLKKNQPGMKKLKSVGSSEISSKMTPFSDNDTKRTPNVVIQDETDEKDHKMKHLWKKIRAAEVPQREHVIDLVDTLIGRKRMRSTTW